MKKIWKQRYQMIEELGRGGTGNVYKVWDLHLEKEWAMKVLEEKTSGYFMMSDTEESMNEVAALKKLSHPNFPRIVDAFEEDDRSILIMDYIQGITLEDMIEKGPVREEEMVLIMSQICEAMLYLHQNTPILLYLDLKPANIIIEENKTIKLVDLGSASVKGKGGKISGSFGYASPEQVKVRQEGIYLTEQSDIFSFGMVLYAMATGSSTRLPIIEAKSRHGVFVRRGNPFLSVSLEKIIEKCTRGNCNRRYASMREVKKDLEIWAACLKRKRGFVMPGFHWRIDRRSLWYQEKSIFCTEGRHSLYIAKKILVLLLCVLCLVPGKVSLARERHRGLYQGEAKENETDKKAEACVKNHEFQEKDGARQCQNINVIIRDSKFRKVLVKKGCAYETGSNILLEIPWEEIEGKECQIVIECRDESQEKKRFYIECIYAK